jgi:hypothetical protein
MDDWLQAPDGRNIFRFRRDPAAHYEAVVFFDQGEPISGQPALLKRWERLPHKQAVEQWQNLRQAGWKRVKPQWQLRSPNPHCGPTPPAVPRGHASTVALALGCGRHRRHWRTYGLQSPAGHWSRPSRVGAQPGSKAKNGCFSTAFTTAWRIAQRERNPSNKKTPAMAGAFRGWSQADSNR